MKWVWLLGSITCEVIGTTFLKLAYGDSPHTGWYAGGVVLFYVLCFGLLGQAMRFFPLSVVYATWSGLGVAALAAIGVVFFGDEVNVLKIGSLALVIAGIVGLNMSGISH